MSICLGCMEEYGDQFEVCPHCGYIKGTPPKEGYYLEPGVMLKKKYLVGRVLGYGGFGVTYIGLDVLLKRKVAIKEYLPSDFSTRVPGEHALTIYTDDATAQFEAGLKKFVDEAQRLAKFHTVPGIVHIYDSFNENNTGYIVMEYLEGCTVKERLKQQGKMEYEEAKNIIFSVLDGLTAVHKEGIIHRDISPDNIFLTKDGKVKLLDFGAARYATTFHSKSLSVILKPGYAPVEQYRSHGNQGPWSDIYAVAATFYKMLTGVTPEESIERAVEDHLQSPAQLGIAISPAADNAIMNALNIAAEDRTQSAEEFRKQLESDNVERNKVEQKREDVGGFQPWMKFLIAGVAVVLITGGILMGTGILRFGGGETMSVEVAADLGENEINAPGVINTELDEAMEIVETSDLVFLITDKQYSDKIPADRVLSQTPLPGRLIARGSELGVIVSGGAEMAVVPNTVGRLLVDVKKELEDLGFVVQEKGEVSEVAAKDTIISQSVSAETELAKGETIILTYSLGSEEQKEIRDVVIPTVTGKSFEEANTMVLELDLFLVKAEEVYSDTIPANQIISQSPAAGTNGKTGDNIEVVVSKGPEKVRVPDVQYKAESEAVSMLESAGLNCRVNYEESAVVQSGHVIRQSINSGNSVNPGTTITITVSTGAKVTSSKPASSSSKPASSSKAPVSSNTPSSSKPASSSSTPSSKPAASSSSSAPVSSKPSGPLEEVPDVTGLDYDSAVDILKDLGFMVSRSYESNPDYAEGIVISQSVAPGSRVQKGSVVRLSVCQGVEDGLNMPNVVGMYEEEAKDLLNELNIYVSISNVYEGGELDTVVSQSIKAGQTITPGTSVTLGVVRDANVTIVPDLTGMSRATAEKTLEELGLDYIVEFEPYDGTPGFVIRQDIDPGTEVDKGTEIFVIVGTDD